MINTIHHSTQARKRYRNRTDVGCVLSATMVAVSDRVLAHM